MKPLLVSLLALGMISLTAAVGRSEDRPQVTVTAEAVVNVRPNKVLLNFGIETWDNQILTAKKKNSDILKKATALLNGLGIHEKDILTDHVSIEPRYRDDDQRHSFVGFYARTTMVVTVSEAAKADEVLTKVLASGVNYIHGVDFQTTEIKLHREQARELALKAAKEKAEKMAAVLGQSVGAPLQINENSADDSGWYWSSWNRWGYSRGQSMSQNAVQNVQSDNKENMVLGKIAVRAHVTVVFELKH